MTGFSVRLNAPPFMLLRWSGGEKGDNVGKTEEEGKGPDTFLFNVQNIKCSFYILLTFICFVLMASSSTRN